MSRKTALILDEHAEWYAERLAGLAPGLDYIAAPTADAALASAAGAEVLIGFAPYLPADLVAAMGRLEWVQALTTGVDNLLKMDEMPAGTAITNCNGIHGPQMSELAILLMLSLARQFPRMVANQKIAKWETWPQPLLANKTVCILGLGAIAEALSKICAAFGMRVTGVSDGRAEVPGFARVYRRAELPAAAAEADFLVILVPYTPKTHHIVNAGVLAAMKPSAFVVNIARGGCLDEAALLAALRDGTIAGAGLDVFGTEPLPEDSPVWSAPNLIATPHIGGYADVYREQALPIVAENLNVFAGGGVDALRGRLDTKGGA